MRFFNVYQYVAPAVLFPISYLFWLRRMGGDHRLVLLMLSVPVVFAYVIPALGTNWLRLWEFNTRLRLGRFRPHHGFVFGSATSLIALVCVTPRPPAPDAFDLFRTAFVLGSVLAFWNWLYDVRAIQAGFITVYNRPYAERRGPAAIATDYAPALFGSFGVCYGLAIRWGEYALLDQRRWDAYGALLAGTNLAGLVIPVLAYVGASYLKHGTSGLKPCAIAGEPEKQPRG